MMPVTPHTLENLHTALLSAFRSRASLEQMVLFHLNKNLNEIASDQSLNTVAFELIRWAESQGRTRDLIAAARKANPGNAALRALRVEVLPRANGPQADVAAESTDSLKSATDPYLVQLLDGDRPFIDRVVLRDHLRRLADGSAQILIVNGPPRSGRSYSLELIFHVSVALQMVRIAQLNVEEEAGAALLDPYTVAQRLARQLPELAGVLPPDPSFKAGNMLASWLVEAFANSIDRWWIVLDGFEHPDVPPATHDFLGQVLLISSTPRLRGRVGVILLAYDERLVPDRIHPYVLIENLVPLSQQDVISFLRQYITGLGMNLSESEIAEIAEAAVGGHSPWDLTNLNRSVTGIVRRFRQHP